MPVGLGGHGGEGVGELPGLGHREPAAQELLALGEHQSHLGAVGEGGLLQIDLDFAVLPLLQLQLQGVHLAAVATVLEVLVRTSIILELPSVAPGRAGHGALDERALPAVLSCPAGEVHELSSQPAQFEQVLLQSGDVGVQARAVEFQRASALDPDDGVPWEFVLAVDHLHDLCQQRVLHRCWESGRLAEAGTWSPVEPKLWPLGVDAP